MNTRVIYFVRCKNNRFYWACPVLPGKMDEPEREMIVNGLYGEQFYPENVGLPEIDTKKDKPESGYILSQIEYVDDEADTSVTAARFADSMLWSRVALTKEKRRREAV